MEVLIFVSISKWGNSAALRLPKNILDALSLQIGDQVNLTLKENTLVIEAAKPSLEELLGKITTENRHVELITNSAGNELL